jgi:hypothetical protein
VHPAGLGGETPCGKEVVSASREEWQVVAWGEARESLIEGAPVAPNRGWASAVSCSPQPTGTMGQPETSCQACCYLPANRPPGWLSVLCRRRPLPAHPHAAAALGGWGMHGLQQRQRGLQLPAAPALQAPKACAAGPAHPQALSATKKHGCCRGQLSSWEAVANA